MILTKILNMSYITLVSRRRVEQLAARRAHNPEAVGSSPTPAILFFNLTPLHKRSYFYYRPLLWHLDRNQHLIFSFSQVFTNKKNTS